MLAVGYGASGGGDCGSGGGAGRGCGSGSGAGGGCGSGDGADGCCICCCLWYTFIMYSFVS